MENEPEKKMKLFESTLKWFKKYDNTDITELSLRYWAEYSGMLRALRIMGWEQEFVDYCWKNGWDVTLS